MIDIKFTPIQEEYLPLLCEWRAKPEVSNYCRTFKPITLLDTKQWFKQLSEWRKTIMQMIWIKQPYVVDWFPIGVCGLVQIEWKNHKAEISFYIGEDKYRTEAVTTAALEKLTDYAFERCGLHKVFFPCYDYNPYVKWYKQIMPIEATLKQEYYYGGKYHNRHILSKFKK